MASFWLALNLGINIPLLLVPELTSKAAEAAGVLVPMPIWENAGIELSRINRLNSK
jgi:hypothetical protein